MIKLPFSCAVYLDLRAYPGKICACNGIGLILRSETLTATSELSLEHLM
jgi:hypothetical protein